MAQAIAISVVAFALGAGLAIWGFSACLKAYVRHVYHCAECKAKVTARFDEHEDSGEKCWYGGLLKEAKGEIK